MDGGFSEFLEKFADLPPSGPRGPVLLKWDWTLLDLLLYFWAFTVLFSAAYIASRCQRRDLVFHSVLGTAIGMTCGAALCLGLWLLFGGWAPPAPEFSGWLAAIKTYLRLGFEPEMDEPGHSARWNELRRITAFA
jgi:hypothetical protein